MSASGRGRRRSASTEQKGGPHQQIARVEGDRLRLAPLAVDELGCVYLLTHGCSALNEHRLKTEQKRAVYKAFPSLGPVQRRARDREIAQSLPTSPEASRPLERSYVGGAVTLDGSRTSPSGVAAESLLRRASTVTPSPTAGSASCTTSLFRGEASRTSSPRSSCAPPQASSDRSH